MEREILFRGKRLDNGEFIEGSLTVDCHGNCCIYHPLNVPIGGGFQYFDIDPETVGQFTGITDKNGTKIFEGDILKFNTFRTKNTGGQKDIVRFEDCGFYPMNDLFYIDGECGDSIELDKDGNYIFEIIGNIYDNK